MNPGEVDRTITEMRAWIDENQVHYDAAQTKMSDPKFVNNTLKSIFSWVKDILSYNPVQHSESVAVFVIGRFQANAGSLFNDIEFIAQFEEEKKRFEEAASEIVADGE